MSGVLHRDSNSFEPREAIKGDLARGLFYMAVRYNGGGDGARGDLVLVETIPSGVRPSASCRTLVAWSLADPPDDRERWRNDKIDGDYQDNRNPFIDHPEWVCSIWGSSVPAGVRGPAQRGAHHLADDQDDPRGHGDHGRAGRDGRRRRPAHLVAGRAQPAAHGTAASPTRRCSYTPTANFAGTDVVGVKVDDNHGHVVTTTVTITVTAVNDAPIGHRGLTASTPRNRPS